MPRVKNNEKPLLSFPTERAEYQYNIFLEVRKKLENKKIENKAKLVFNSEKERNDWYLPYLHKSKNDSGTVLQFSFGKNSNEEFIDNISDEETEPKRYTAKKLPKRSR